MSKYVRTKSSLFCVVKENEDSFTVKSLYEKRPLLDEFKIGKWAVISQADTIEELCDRMIQIIPGIDPVVMSEKTFYYLKNSMSMKDNIINGIKKGYSYYGAIWTKGESDEPILKSISKMNKDGKLELI